MAIANDRLSSPDRLTLDQIEEVAEEFEEALTTSSRTQRPEVEIEDKSPRQPSLERATQASHREQLEGIRDDYLESTLASLALESRRLAESYLQRLHALDAQSEPIESSERPSDTRTHQLLQVLHGFVNCHEEWATPFPKLGATFRPSGQHWIS